MNWMVVEKWVTEEPHPGRQIYTETLGNYWIPVDKYREPPTGIGYIFPDIDCPGPWVCCDSVPVQGESQVPIDPDYLGLVPVQEGSHNA